MRVDQGRPGREVPGPGATPCGSGPILVRPDWAALGGDLPGRVTAVRFGGPHTDYEIGTPAGTVLIRQSGRPRRAPGEVTGWSLRRVWLAGAGDPLTAPAVVTAPH
jgi:hypothetical protein